jgi:AcrR family transcriptional regulator
MVAKIKNAREIILKHGKDVLLKKGTGFSISFLMSQCGMGTGTFYNYFINKDGLILNIIDYDWDKIIDDIEKIDQLSLPSHREKAFFIYSRIDAFVKRYNFPKLQSNMKKPAKDYAAHREDCVRKMAAKLECLIARDAENENINIDFDVSKMAKLIIYISISVAKDPDLSFDDLWNFVQFRGFE